MRLMLKVTVARSDGETVFTKKVDLFLEKVDFIRIKLTFRLCRLTAYVSRLLAISVVRCPLSITT